MEESSYIVEQVHRWYNDYDDLFLSHDKLCGLISMVAKCIIASQVDSGVCHEAEEVLGI